MAVVGVGIFALYSIKKKRTDSTTVAVAPLEQVVHSDDDSDSDESDDESDDAPAPSAAPPGAGRSAVVAPAPAPGQAVAVAPVEDVVVS